MKVSIRNLENPLADYSLAPNLQTCLIEHRLNSAMPSFDFGFLAGGPSK
jgi:hypothetical protein